MKKPAGMRRGELESIRTRVRITGVQSLCGPKTASRPSKEIKVSQSLSLEALRSSSKMKVKQKAISLHPPQMKTQAGRTDRQNLRQKDQQNYAPTGGKKDHSLTS